MVLIYKSILGIYTVFPNSKREITIDLKSISIADLVISLLLSVFDFFYNISNGQREITTIISLGCLETASFETGEHSYLP